MRKYLLIAITCFSLCAEAAPVSEADLQRKADLLFSRRDYELAYDYYLKLRAIQPERLLYQFRAGVCAIYAGDGATALGFLKTCIEKDTALQDINFFLGRAYLLNNLPSEARTYFMKQVSKEPDEAQRKRLGYYVQYCTNAMELMQKPVNALVQNAGRPLNSPGDEYAPVFTPDGAGLLFTYKGVNSTGGRQPVLSKKDSAGIYFEDVVDSRLTANGSWSIPLPLSDSVNTPTHEASIALSPDGQNLYIFRSSEKNGGDIYVCKKAGLDWRKPEKLKGEINSPHWEGSIAFSSDGKTAYFASDRPNGYGGKDIYRARLQDDGSWAQVENLGPNVNTEMDDDAPFIYAQDKKMSYSSKGQGSIGGYDVFISELSEDGKTWKEGVNIGYPLNSTMDDIYYVIASDGLTAFFCSNRTGGNGGLDLYMMEPGTPAKKGDLVLIKGRVTLDDLPTLSTVSVTTGKDSLFGDYRSNPATGKYAVSLPPGTDYKLTFIVSGCGDSVRTYDASQVSSFISKEFEVAFYSDQYKRVHFERFGIKDTSALTKKLTQLTNDSMMIGGEKMVVRRDLSSNYKDETGAQVEKGTFVVIGSFKNLPYAKRLRDKIRADKKYPTGDLVLNQKNGFTYVIVARPKTAEEAANIARLARKEYPDAWVQQLE